MIWVVGAWFTSSVVQSLSRVQLFATQWTAACQASLSFTISRSFLKLRSTESVMPSNHLIPSSPPLLLPLVGSWKTHWKTSSERGTLKINSSGRDESKVTLPFCHWGQSLGPQTPPGSWRQPGWLCSWPGRWRRRRPTRTPWSCWWSL